MIGVETRRQGRALARLHQHRRSRPINPVSPRKPLLGYFPAFMGTGVVRSGPPVFVRAGKNAFLSAGFDADHLFYDSFDYAFETWPKLG